MPASILGSSFVYPTQRIVTIAATQRTGSNLLCRALAATSLLGVPREHLLPERMAMGTASWGVPRVTLVGKAGQALRWLRGDKHWRFTSCLTPDSVRDYLLRVAVEHTGPSGTLCWKTMWISYRDVMLVRGLDVGVWNLPAVWIRIRRLDRVRQAVSFAKALQTKQWLASQPACGEPTYDRELIARCEAMIASQESAWDGYFASRAITPIEVTYESLTTAHHSVIKDLLVSLGHPNVESPPPQLQRQADQLSDDWAHRYLRERS